MLCDARVVDWPELVAIPSCSDVQHCVSATGSRAPLTMVGVVELAVDPVDVLAFVELVRLRYNIVATLITLPRLCPVLA